MCFRSPRVLSEEYLGITLQAAPSSTTSECSIVHCPNDHLDLADLETNTDYSVVKIPSKTRGQESIRDVDVQSDIESAKYRIDGCMGFASRQLQEPTNHRYTARIQLTTGQ